MRVCAYENPSLFVIKMGIVEANESVSIGGGTIKLGDSEE
jgi:hypothetical protein